MDQQQAASNQITVFYSYAHADERLRQQLETHLGLLRQQGIIATWHDRQIVPGTDWAQEMDGHLTTARVILLLISPDFLASDYCYGVELRRALERHNANEARVIPVLLRPVADWKEAPFARLAMLPTNVRPVTTWRNRDQAWADVIAGIRRAIEKLPRLTVSTPRTALPAVWNIPYPRNPIFTGREEVLSRLAKLLQIGQPMALTQPQAISGLGGIGKTQLAVEYAYRYHSDYQAVLWARAESREALISAFFVIAGLLKLPEQDEQEHIIAVNVVKEWLHKHTGWLLVLDNADDLVIIPEFLPPSVGGHVLLTTRAQALGRLASRIEVDTLDPDTGALLLLRRAGLLALDAPLSQAAEADQRLALQLCQELLGGLPLALDQAGAYLEETRCSLQQYLDLYRNHRADLLGDHRGFIEDHPDSVATTWSLSFTAIEQRSAVAADLLRLCAVLHPDAIPEELFLQGAAYLGATLATIEKNSLALNSALAVIQSYSLLRRNSQEQTLSIHRLVQAVLHDAITEQERNQWRERAIAALDAVFPKVTHEVWEQCERLLPHVLTCGAAIASQKRSLELTSLLAKTADYLRERARYEQAELLYLRALHILEQALGSEHPNVAATLNNLAVLYFKHGRYEQAEPLYLRALHIWEQTLGPRHPDLALSLNNLAIFYREQGKYQQAESLYLRALHIWEQTLGSEHPNVALSLNNLATLYREQGKYEQAEPLYLRALHIWEQTLGSEHPNVAATLNNLAVLYFKHGRYEQAEPLYLRALHIREQALGSEHPDVAYPLNGLATLYREQGKYEQAEPLYLRSLRILEQALESEHPDVAVTLNNLAVLYLKQDRYEQAEPLFLRALHIWEHALGSEHPTLTSPLNGLADLYREQGKYQQAEPLFLRALRILEQALGSEHPGFAYPLNNLANLYLDQGKYEQAEPLFLRALHIWEHALGSEHPDVAATLNNLAVLYLKQDRYEQAEPLFLRALHIWEHALGSEHPHTIDTRTCYAHLLRATGRPEEAAALEVASAQQATTSDQEPS